MEPILTTSLVQFSLEDWENVLFELGSEGVKARFGPSRFRRGSNYVLIACFRSQLSTRGRSR